ncbi:MAG TPA: hypothetical protein VLN45_06140 [Ignavibacteriaceae bacterium]|nr:hypothetical protein [Ignavibacteriaceae bacterium]
MGDIVFWTLLRFGISIPLLWIIKDYLSYSLWWVSIVLVLYGFVLYPAFRSYKRFEEKNKNILEASLCSSCNHFDKTAVLCIKYDKHPTNDFVPCEGMDWEPKNFEDISES